MTKMGPCTVPLDCLVVLLASFKPYSASGSAAMRKPREYT
jgi:hypothetical protein